MDIYVSFRPESLASSHLNPDHRDPITLPPAASTLTPSPLSNRTFSPLCLPVTPPLVIPESASLIRGKKPSNKTVRKGTESLLLPKHVLQLERSGVGDRLRNIRTFPSKSPNSPISSDDPMTLHGSGVNISLLKMVLESEDTSQEGEKISGPHGMLKRGMRDRKR